MPLREEFESQGNWLFRWRSYLPLSLFLLVALAMRDFNYPRHEHKWQEWWMLCCLAVSLTGLAIRVMTVGYVPKGTSGGNTARQIAETLNTTGMYSLVRHPLYLGNYLIWLGIPLFFHTCWLVTIFSLLFWLYYERIMFAEEEFLRRKFGWEYIRWATETPAFIPRLRGWRSPDLSFSLRNVLRREYSAVFGIVAVFCGLEILEHLAVEHRFYFEAHWRIIAPAGLAVYLLLRTLKRRTRVLAVLGR
jgi:protein-S-isoprenylcysteine O-methyltransferase Ste14